MDRLEVFWLANAITVARVILVPVVFGLILRGEYQWALGFFLLAAVSDFLDGWVARNLEEPSMTGAWLDPLADKILVVLSLVALGQHQAVEPWVIFVVVVREFAIMGLRLQSSEPLPANLFGKTKTVLQMLVIVVALLRFTAPWTWWLQVGVGAWTALSLLTYLRRR